MKIMKTQLQTTITFAEIIAVVEANEPKEAREILSSSNGAILECTGQIEKVIKRGGGLRLFIKPGLDPNQRPMMLFAEFTGEAERQKAIDLKICKGAKVSIAGKFRTAGYKAATMDDCRLIEIITAAKL